MSFDGDIVEGEMAAPLANKQSDFNSADSFEQLPRLVIGNWISSLGLSGTSSKEQEAQLEGSL